MPDTNQNTNYMGWKNIKEQYGITHIVQVTDKGICIGSPYVGDLIVVKADGTVEAGIMGVDGNDKLQRYFNEMSADKEKLAALISAEDTFAKSIPVYTYEGGQIIVKQCEELGWPNVTHDGQLMYANSFSGDKSEVVMWAKRNARAGVEITERCVEARVKALAETAAILAALKADLNTLETNHPSTPDGPP